MCLAGAVQAQPKPVYDQTRTDQVLGNRATLSKKYIGIPSGPTPGFPSYVPDSVKCGSLFNKTTSGVADTLKIFDCFTQSWVNAGSSTLKAGTVVTSTPSVGLSTPTAQALIDAFYQSQPPTALISGGIPIELTSAATITQPVNYAYGKQTGTQNIASATIGGSTSGITQSASGASGSVSETFTANVSATYSLVVTTVDSKTASASTTFTFLPKRYWGRCTGTAPSSSEILAAAGGGSNLSASRAGTFTVTASGSNYVFYAMPVSLGAVVSIKDASTNADVTSAFNRTTVSFTNASGYTQNYYVYTSQSATGGNYSFIIS